MTRRWVSVAGLVLAVVAAVAMFGPDRGGPSGRTAGDVINYVREQRADLGAPGMAVGAVEGSAGREAGAGSAEAETPFVIGSVTKSFTALAVMQLVESGRVGLDDPVVRHVPTFRTRNATASMAIAVRELLSQTSGLSTAAGEDPFTRPATTLSEQVGALRDTVAGAPGVFAYSNANYEVLGELVESVSGQTYGHYLQDHVLKPLEMRHTYTDLVSARAGGLRAGHRIWFGAPLPDGVYYRSDFLPAGFLVSTVSDLDRYMTALLEGGRYHGRSVLSAAGVQALLSPAVSASGPGRHQTYGFGWFQERVGGRNLVFVPGSAHNSHAALVLVPDHHVGVAVAADAESVLYYVLPKFDLVAFNAADLASGGAVQGTVGGLYLVFDALIGLALFFYIRNLVRVLRHRQRGYAGLSRLSAARGVWRELVSPALILVGLPLYLGFSWVVLLGSDVGLAAALIAGLGVAALAARVVFALRSPSAAATPSGAAATMVAR